MVRLLLAFLLWSGAAGAATIDGATLPDTYPVDGQNLQLNGIGIRTYTVFNVRIYVAGLYLAQRSHDPQAIVSATTPKVMLLQFLHSGSKSEVQDEFRKGEKENCGGGGCDPADATDFDRMAAAAPAVAVGDTFTFIITSRGVRFYVNNKLLVDSNNADLGRLILLGYIGNHPPTADLRKRLLGN